MRFVSDRQRRAVFAHLQCERSQNSGKSDDFANMNSFSHHGYERLHDSGKCVNFSQVNQYAADMAKNMAYPPMVKDYFAIDPIKSYDIERSSVGVPFNFPVNTKKYYDGRIYIYPGEAFTIRKALEDMAPSMNIEDSVKAKIIAEELGADIVQHEIEGKESEGMVFLNDNKLDFIERIFGGEFSLDPIETYAMAEDIKYWTDMDKETGVGKAKPDKKHAKALRLDLKIKKILDEQNKTVPVEGAIQ